PAGAEELADGAVVPVECAHVAIACPYKELAGRFCMQVQVHEKALSIKKHFKAFMNPAEIFSGVGKKIFNKTLKKMFENEVHCFLTTQCFQLLNCIESHRIVLNPFLSTFIFSCIVSWPCIEIRIGSSFS